MCSNNRVCNLENESNSPIISRNLCESVDNDRRRGFMSRNSYVWTYGDVVICNGYESGENKNKEGC